MIFCIIQFQFCISFHLFLSDRKDSDIIIIDDGLDHIRGCFPLSGYDTPRIEGYNQFTYGFGAHTECVVIIFQNGFDIMTQSISVNYGKDEDIGIKKISHLDGVFGINNS